MNLVYFLPCHIYSCCSNLCCVFAFQNNYCMFAIVRDLTWDFWSSLREGMKVRKYFLAWLRLRLDWVVRFKSIFMVSILEIMELYSSFSKMRWLGLREKKGKQATTRENMEWTLGFCFSEKEDKRVFLRKKGEQLFQI